MGRDEGSYVDGWDVTPENPECSSVATLILAE